jgi:ABC-type nitrate/sulfonate/bicarbonate transport system substrate-binding protein
MTPSSQRPLLSRGSVIKGLAAAVVSAPAFLRNVNAQGLTKLKYTMSWLPEGTFAYVYVAKAMGYWKDRGLDVDVSRGFGSLASAQALASGQFDFGMSTVDATVVLATKGVDLRCLAMLDYVPTMGVAILDKSPIKTPKDLEGKTVGQTVASSDAAFFPEFCKRAGVDYSKVKVVNIDAKIRNQTLVEGRVDAITGIATSIIPAVTSSGSDVRYLLYTDYGLPLYGNINLLARPQSIAAQPDICRALTDGVLQAMKFTLTNPDEAQAVFIKAVPELSMSGNPAPFVKLGMDIQRYTVASNLDVKKSGLGWTDQTRVGHMATSVMQFETDMGSIKPDIATIFSNKFAGRVKFTDAEWAAVQKNTPTITTLLKKKA